MLMWHIYPSAKECFEYIYPRLNQGGIIVFDDYGFPDCDGVKQAVDEFVAKHKLEILSLPTGQAVYFHNKKKK